jgi:hypothetical protein
MARERANISHHALEKMLAKIAKGLGLKPRYNQNIDIYFDIGDCSLLAEIKSCTDDNFHAQIRKGISQLFEYRFYHKELLQPEVQMLLLVETPPPKGKTWLVDYAESLGVTLAWKDPESSGLKTTAKVSKALARFVEN